MLKFTYTQPYSMDYVSHKIKTSLFGMIMVHEKMHGAPLVSNLQGRTWWNYIYN